MVAVKMHPRSGTCECERTVSRRGKRARAREDEMNAMFNTEPFAAAIGSGQAGRRKDMNRRRSEERGDFVLLLLVIII